MTEQMPPPVEQEEGTTKVVCEIQTRKTEKVLIGRREYKGKSYVEARVWYIPNEAAATWYPTKKGFILPIAELPKLIGAFCDLAEEEKSKPVEAAKESDGQP